MLNKQVGKLLGITERTVKTHRGQIMHKLDVVSVAELVRLAQKRNRFARGSPNPRVLPQYPDVSDIRRIQIARRLSNTTGNFYCHWTGMTVGDQFTNGTLAIGLPTARPGS